MSHHPLRVALAATLTTVLSASLAGAQCLVTKLTADDARAENQFGYAIAVQGNEIFVGSPLENLAEKDAGSVQVLRRVGLHWFLRAKLTAPEPDARLGFGTSLAVDGNTLVVAGGAWAPALYVYERAGSGWLHAATLPGPAPTAGTPFGFALAVRGDWIFAGASQDSTEGTLAGAVFTYQRTDAGWTEAGRLVSSDVAAGDQFGESLVASGDLLVVGAPLDEGGTGAAYVFERSGSSWIERQKLVGEPNDRFAPARGLALRDGTLAVLGGLALYVYEDVGGSWGQSARLTMQSPTTSPLDGYGRCVAITDQHVLVSTITNPESSIFAYRRGAPRWSEVVRLQPDDMTNGAYVDRYGYNIAASGDIAVVAADNSAQRASGAGAIFVYSMSGALCGTLSSSREFSWGKQRLEIDRGPEHAGHLYHLLGSLSGSSRGIPYRGTRIPLNLDRYFVALLRTPQLALFQPIGALDHRGRASLVLRVPPEAYPYIVGLTLTHAFIEVGPLGFEHVSNAVQVRFGTRH